MGLTPVDLPKISVKKQENKANPFAELAAEISTNKIQ
jgi:hypothetical protein